MAGSVRTDSKNVELTMLPVSAGDATLIAWSDGGTRHTVLIDAGLRENDAVSYLQSIGIFHLDLIILSHPDLDHLGGLLAIMRSRAMSVGRIWCFDLAFLREFIQEGRIPCPKPATHEVVYAYALRSTLDQFSDILKTASDRKVQVLQVSEGHKLSLGGVLLEVLYPPQSLYHALHDTVALKQMLNRKLPDDWERDLGDGEDATAQPVSSAEREDRLADMIDRPEMPADGVHLSDLTQEYENQRGDESEEERRPPEGQTDQLPWRMVGTLYNNLSIVVKATVLGGINPPSILLPGDLSDWTTLVIRQWPNLKSDILKIPHHGSKNVTCDLRAVHNALAHPLVYYFVERGYPFPWPFCRRLLSSEWRRFHHLIHRGAPLSVIRYFVRPSHVLVFPHPQHHLPDIPLDQCGSNVIANRVHRDVCALNQTTNMPSAARILVGLEREDVTEV